MEKKEKIVGVCVVSTMIQIGIAFIVPIGTQVTTVNGWVTGIKTYDDSSNITFTIDGRMYSMTADPDAQELIDPFFGHNVTLVYKTTNYIIKQDEIAFVSIKEAI